MCIDPAKLKLAMARKCLNTLELCDRAGMKYQAFRRVSNGKVNCKPSTVGRIARALGVDVTEIIEADGGEREW